MKRERKKSGLVLLICSILAKGLGLFYRVPLFAILSVESVGIYQLVFPIYAFLVSIISGGIPVTVSKKTSEYFADDYTERAEKVADSGLVFYGIISLLFSVALLCFSPYVSKFLGNINTKSSIISIAPSIFFACIIAVMRGYFQGQGKWSIVGFSFISEQVIKCIGILFLFFNSKIGVIGAILGVTIAEGLTAIFMLIFYIKQRISRFSFSFPTKSFIFYCVSVSIGLIAMPLNSFIDGIAVVNLISKNLNPSQATGLYGIMSGAVAPLISVPFVITSSFTAYLLPLLCARKQQERVAIFNQKSKQIILLSAFFACSYFVFAPTIVKILYPSLKGQDFIVCVKLLKTASPIVLTSSLLALMTTFLQSANKPFLPAIILFFSVGIKCLILPFCISLASIYGAQIANVVVYVVAFCLCCVFALKYGFSFSLKGVFSITFSATLFLFVVLEIYYNIPTFLGCVIAFIVGASLSFSLFFAIEKVKIEKIKKVQKNLK